MNESDGKIRCYWSVGDPLMEAYHDEEWGVPLHDDQRLFEFLVLDGAQAGLSWRTVLRKREAYREAMDQFDPVKIAAYGEEKIEELLANPGIIRNRLKIRSAVTNAQAMLAVQQEMGSFDRYLWSFVDGAPICRHRQTAAEIPATSLESDRLSKDLQKRGFRFVGSTICYAFMQAAGMINDHTVDCFRYSTETHHGELLPAFDQQAPR